MFRIFAIGLGSLLVTLGITWFFTSLLDGVLSVMGGSMIANVTPMSKMTLADNLSWLFAGLSITGAGLLALAIFTAAPDRDQVAKVD